jgi:hypothetical protein
MTDLPLAGNAIVRHITHLASLNIGIDVFGRVGSSRRVHDSYTTVEYMIARVRYSLL